MTNITWEYTVLFIFGLLSGAFITCMILGRLKGRKRRNATLELYGQELQEKHFKALKQLLNRIDNSSQKDLLIKLLQFNVYSRNGTVYYQDLADISNGDNVINASTRFRSKKRKI